MKTEYTSQELRRLPGVTYDTLRTWAGRRNGDSKRKGNHRKHQPVLLSPIRKPGSTRCWVYGSDAVERIWWIRMLQMLGYNNEEIEKIVSDPEKESSKEVWGSLDEKINDLNWKIRNLAKAQQFAETIRRVGTLPSFPHKEGVNDIDRYLEVLPTEPRLEKTGYEEGSRKLLKAHGYDKDKVIAQSGSPEFLKHRDEILLAIKELWLLQMPADARQILFLMDVFYKELFEKQGFDLGVFHGMGRSLAKPRELGLKFDSDYGPGFAAFLAEAVFIYCFTHRNRQPTENGKEQPPS